MGSLLSYVLDLIFFVIVAKMLGRVVQNLLGPSPSRGRGPSTRSVESSQVRAGKTKRDPVCGIFVSTELSHQLVRGSETLHFCSNECLERYQKDEANVSA